MPRRAACRAGPSIGLILILIALAVRLLVPAGYMFVPGEGAGTLPTLVICDGMGPAMAAAPMQMQMQMPMPMPMQTVHGMAGHGANQHDGKSEAADHGCPFASAAAALDRAPPPLAPLLLPAQVLLLPTRLLLARPGLGLAAPPPPSRGPPAI